LGDRGPRRAGRDVRDRAAPVRPGGRACGTGRGGHEAGLSFPHPPPPPGGATWVLYFLLAARRDQPPRRAHLVGLYGCIMGAMWIKGLPALLVVPAGAAAVLAARGRSGFASLRPVLGFGLVAVAMLPWAIPYLLTPGHHPGQSTSAGTALSWYLDRFERVSSIPLT